MVKYTGRDESFYTLLPTVETAAETLLVKSVPEENRGD